MYEACVFVQNIYTVIFFKKTENGVLIVVYLIKQK